MTISSAFTSPTSEREPIGGPLAWRQDSFSDPSVYTIDLAKDRLHIDNALEFLLDLGLDPEEIDHTQFPLPSSVVDKLQQCAHTIHEGVGFCVLRGATSCYSVEDSVTVFLGIASYIGDQRGLQNKQGHMLSHITESKGWEIPRNERHGIHSNASLPFHTDMGTDIVALHVRGCSAEGGNTYVSSASSVFNDLLSRPGVLQTLLEPNWPIQISKKQARTTCVVRSLLEPEWPAAPCRYIQAPLLTFHQGRLLVSVDPARLGPQSSPRGSDKAPVPDLSIDQRVALEALKAACHRNRVRIEARPGDIILFNNWALLHSRDAYLDTESHTRHLVRLWLRNSKLGWSIPTSMSVPWQYAYGDDPVDRIFPVVPTDVYPTLKYTAGSAAFVLEDSDEE